MPKAPKVSTSTSASPTSKSKRGVSFKAKPAKPTASSHHTPSDASTSAPTPAILSLKSALKKPKAKKPVVVVEEDPELDDEEQEALHLKGFSGDEGDDSSEDDDEEVDKHPPIDIGTLPTIAKDDETVRKRLAEAKRRPSEARGVIHVGHIPHGFYEDQMRGYFSQFGDITRLRLSRNKKTGRSKHYAFIEFDSAAVAEIVADTMDNYLLHGHILKCKVVPKDRIHPTLWVGANRKYKKIPHDRIARVTHNKDRTKEQQKRAEARLFKRQNSRAAKLGKLGIKYDFKATGYQPNPVTT
ncbi:hypothetical protein FRB94_007972 [Tulasnella sp. JGI-2019a]|nr:hypothetical protein FRB94_007972 [Tulasnella sp. JGI-2019a]